MSSISILGIHDGHNCGATLVVDGKVVASLSEERITRTKNEVGYPARSIEAVLRLGSVDPSELTSVAYSSNYMHDADYLRNHGEWYLRGIEDQRRDFARDADRDREKFIRQRQRRVKQVIAHLAVPEDRIRFVEHHTAHLAAAYFTSPHYRPDRSFLGLTCDGSGDGVSASVSICRNNELRRISAADRHASLGKIYSRVTFMMGMTPWEHEYKLMGMAPYSDPERSRAAARPLHDLLSLDNEGTGFALRSELSTNYCYDYLVKSFERVRFDTICGATQLHCEELLVDWVRNCIRETGLTDIVAGGGVFMNVKANMLIARIPELTSFYIMPSAGDESLSFGSALLDYYERTGRTDHGDSALTNLYLGGSSTRREEEAAIRACRDRLDIEVEEPTDVPARVAELIADGRIVACCRGRMEWGARALGNRSILTSAEDYGRVDQINQMIKMRDFWMPFAPSIREESADRYFENPKDIKAWFMTFAFPSIPSTYSELRAGSHPRDKTLRPQVVCRSANPDYHRIISRFHEQTGRGVVLNTSFNLHGEPIVNTAADALRVMELSGLEHVALNGFVVRKRGQASAAARAAMIVDAG